MLEALYILVVMGCADDLSGCQAIERVGGWSNAAVCEAAIPGMFERHGGADYPMVIGKCEQAPASLVAGQQAVKPPAG